VVGRLEAARTELRDADGAQQRAIDGLPPKTASVYENKGRLLGLLRQLARAGRFTFRGQPDKRRAYSLGALRARRANGAAAPVTGTAEQGAVAEQSLTTDGATGAGPAPAVTQLPPSA
jgi:hypothetical protein